VQQEQDAEQRQRREREEAVSGLLARRVFAEEFRVVAALERCFVSS
jgi:hypothetical protein